MRIAPGSVEMVLSAPALRPSGSLRSYPIAPGDWSNWGVESNYPGVPYKKTPPYGEVFLYGTPGEIRTPDQVVRSHLLYPAELRVLKVL